MSQYKVPEADDLFQCPYDDTHMVRAKRWPYHLIKCRKNHVGVDLVVCPFNARHEISGGDFRYHVAHCPDKALVEQDINLGKEEKDIPVGSHRVKICEWDMPEGEEDWSNDIPRGPIRKINPTKPKPASINIEDEQKKRLVKVAQENVERLKQGLPLVEAREKLVSEPTTNGGFRLPSKQPKALQNSLSSGSNKKGSQSLRSVFEYSVSLSGVGRGRGVLKMFQEKQVGFTQLSSDRSLDSVNSSRESRDDLGEMIEFSSNMQSADTFSVSGASKMTSLEEKEERLDDVFPCDVSVYRMKNDFSSPGVGSVLVSAGVGRGRKGAGTKPQGRPGSSPQGLGNR